MEAPNDQDQTVVKKHRHRRGADSLVAVALANGATIKQAAEAGHVGERTVQRWLADDREFATTVRRLRHNLAEQVLDELHKIAPRAVQVLGELLDPSVPHTTRHRAASTILHQVLNYQNEAALEQRLRNLETQAARLAASDHDSP
jgi:hypothetical protein